MLSDRYKFVQEIGFGKLLCDLRRELYERLTVVSMQATGVPSGNASHELPLHTHSIDPLSPARSHLSHMLLPRNIIPPKSPLSSFIGPSRPLPLLEFEPCGVR